MRWRPLLSNLDKLVFRANFLRQGGILSGRLEANENLTLSAGSYTSEGSLYIDGTLALAKCCNSDECSAGFFVENGALYAVGTTEQH